MFSDFIHPSMLELNKLNILSSPKFVHWYHAAHDLAMEEDLPVAGPSHVAQAGVEEGDPMSSWVVTQEAAKEDMLEKVGSGEAGASGLVQEEKNK